MKKRVLIVLGILIAAGGIGTGVWYHFGSDYFDPAGCIYLSDQ